MNPADAAGVHRMPSSDAVVRRIRRSSGALPIDRDRVREDGSGASTVGPPCHRDPAALADRQSRMCVVGRPLRGAAARSDTDEEERGRELGRYLGRGPRLARVDGLERRLLDG
jgi:hypothetical protein